MLGFTFDIELNTEQPFIIDLDMEEFHTQTLSGAIALKLDRAEGFKVATIAIYGHIGAMLNIGTPDQAQVRENLIESTVDLIAANDTEGKGTIHFESGEQYLPFRIDVPRSGELPPTLINKLDTPYIDWKYEIHATLRRDFIFSTTRIVKHDLILRRRIPVEGEETLTTSMDRPGQFRSKLTVPGRVVLGQDRLLAQAELKARSKEFVIKEVNCAIVQTEDIHYLTKRGHPVENAHVPGAPCKVQSSRVVSSIASATNDSGDMDFGRHTPLDLSIRVDNDQLIPTEKGLGWLDISHMLRYTVYFMDVGLAPIITEVPLFVGNEVVSKARASAMKPQMSAARLVDSLKIAGTDEHCLHSEKEATPEADS